MTSKLKERLEQLRQEFVTGQDRLAKLDTERANLRDTLLRISGAIQVLEEELGEKASEIKTPSDGGEATTS